MAYDSSAQEIKLLKRELLDALATVVCQLNKLNAHLLLITEEEDPPREPTDDL